MKDSLSITDNRTGATHELSIVDGAVRASDLGQIGSAGNRLKVFDPGLVHTATCHSSITYLDGDRGILEHRGYPIEQLAEHSSYLEVAYLLVRRELPTSGQLDDWSRDVMSHAGLPREVETFVAGFPSSAHHMSMQLAVVATLPSLFPEASNVSDPALREQQAMRIIAMMPTIAASCYRHTQGLGVPVSDESLGYSGNFLSMLFQADGRPQTVDPRLVHSLDTMFVLHADHEQNCSTNVVRAVGSAHADPFSSVAAGIAALYGPLHGGANEAVVQMLRRIGSIEQIPEFLARVKAGEERLMGFGHRVYKNYDPRARIIKAAADDVFEVTGVSPLLGIALELERVALEDRYFIERKLYPNVDFYSGLIYEALHLPATMFPVLFAIARTSGWMAQWLEMSEDPTQKITRPRQIYTGPRTLTYQPR